MFRLACYSLATIIMASFSLQVPATVVRFDLEFGAQPAGSIYIDLFDAAAPISVANFLNYVDNGAGLRRYDGTLLHRKVSAFILQGGGFAYDPGLGDFSVISAPPIQSDPPIVNEFDPSRSNERGTIALAKLGGNPDSATSQWFFNLADNSTNLDNQNGGFTVFGQVLGNGMELVDAIDALDVVNSGGPFTAIPVLDTAAPVTETNLITLSAVVINPPASISSNSVDSDVALAVINSLPSISTIIIQNIGGQDLTINSFGGADGLVAPFSFSAAGGAGSCLPGQTLASTATCTIEVAFAPSALGDFTDSFDISSSDVNKPGLTINVRGTGLPETPVLVVAPTALVFGNVGTGQPAELSVTVRNLGGGWLDPRTPAFSGGNIDAFTSPIADNTCNSVRLSVGQTCTMSVRLFSFSLGAVSASLDVVADDSTGSTQTIQVDLSGNVTLLEPEIQLPTNLSVPDIRLGESSVTALSITNAGIDDLYVTSISVEGSDAGLFAVTLTNCIDVAIAPQSSCSEQISFSSTESGVFSAVVRVQSNDLENLLANVPVTATASQDGDGVADAVEAGSPNNGDGNLDGIADTVQDNVTSLPDINGQYITLETEDGLRLVNVQAIQNPSPTNTPTVGVGSLDFRQGFFSFAVEGISLGGQAAVTLYLPAGQPANNYFKFGRLPNESLFFVPEHWYEFLFDSASQTGAVFLPGKVVLNFVDGGRGDNDQTADGRISDPGGPASLSVGGGSSSSGGGGCSLLSQLSGRSSISLDFFILLAMLVLPGFYRRCFK